MKLNDLLMIPKTDDVAYRGASRINLYLRAIFQANRENFVDGRTYVGTYGLTSKQSLLGRLKINE